MAGGTADVIRWIRFSAILMQVSDASRHLCSPGDVVFVDGREQQLAVTAQQQGQVRRASLLGTHPQIKP
jgi:hypothetical protein